MKHPLDLLANIFRGVISPRTALAPLHRDLGEAQNPDYVYFGRIYEEEGGVISEDGLAPEGARAVMIDFYVPISGDLIPLPGITSDPRLIAQFQSMPRGQAFRITKESPWGGMGTRVEAITLVDARLFEPCMLENAEQSHPTALPHRSLK
jgi:hypothetical protein